MYTVRVKTVEERANDTLERVEKYGNCLNKINSNLDKDLAELCNDRQNNKISYENYKQREANLISLAFHLSLNCSIHLK